MENLLKVHSFESFGTVDGPGIRFVVFLAGCPLRCKYCQNRDTWDIGSGHDMDIGEISQTILRYQSYIKPNRSGLRFLVVSLCFRQRHLFCFLRN